MARGRNEGAVVCESTLAALTAVRFEAAYVWAPCSIGPTSLGAKIATSASHGSTLVLAERASTSNLGV